MIELLGEAIFGLCQAEEQGLQDILKSWLNLKPTMEKLKVQWIEYIKIIYSS